MSMYLYDSNNWQLHNTIPLNKHVSVRFYQLTWLRPTMAQTYA